MGVDQGADRRQSRSPELVALENMMMADSEKKRSGNRPNFAVLSE
jgi:hypothetical protein